MSLMTDQTGVDRRRYTKSSSFVMALLFTFLCGAAAVIMGYFINYFATGQFTQNTSAVLESEIRYVDSLGYIPETEGASDRLYIELPAADQIPERLLPHISISAKDILVLDHPDNQKKYAARIHSLPNGTAVLIGYDITDVSQDFRFMQWLGVASIFFVMIVVFVSYLISVFVVRGTNQIADTAYEIMETGDLSQRVEVKSRWDDLSNMAAVLNRLLARIEDLMDGVRQVSDNIAHDLRTPLTRMKHYIEKQQNHIDEQTYTALMSEADRLLETFNALLRISRIESVQQRSQFTQTDLDVLLHDVVSFYEPLAENKNITLNIESQQVIMHGDRNLLFQAYANLLDNAIKFTHEGGEIKLRLYTENNSPVVEISDNGPGVDDAATDKIFQRFYRADESRSTAGTGLGLSLVAAVIELHGGRINAKNLMPGLQIITIF